ncbi:hypothetical protein MHU86_23411 [Fragilaria crotonensis]|nr:hypothetical protein MHU86_23411 [Fragilaria crotonensis]
MKKFMQTSAVAKEVAARKGERDSMLMGLNSTAGSDDVDDDPADSLAYGHMRIRKDGTVMADSEIRELRQRQGYCLTCPGEPIKLFSVKRSKMNPLYQKKEPIEILNQCINGVCLKCNSGNPSGVRRGSFGKPSSGGTANADMLPGTLLSLQTDPYFKQMRKISSFGANGIGEISSGSILSPPGTTGGSMNGGFGTSTGPDLSPDQIIPLSSQNNGAQKRRASSSKITRSNSGDIAKVTRSLTPTRLHALRRSNSDDSIVSTGINGALRVLPPPNFSIKRSKSSDFDASLDFDIAISQGRSSSILANQVAESDPPMELDSQRTSEHVVSNTVEPKFPTWKEIADIAVRAKREKDAFGVSKSGSSRNCAQTQ